MLRARVRGERVVQLQRRQHNCEQVGDGKVGEKVVLKSTDPTAQLQASHRRMLLEQNNVPCPSVSRVRHHVELLVVLERHGVVDDATIS